MSTEEEMMESEFFIMLDVLNNARVNERASWNANVQIVYPPNQNSSLDINAIMNRFKNVLKFEVKRKRLFTITLNQDAGYKAQHFR